MTFAKNHNHVSDSTIVYPIKVKVSLNLEDLNDVEIKNNFFTAKLWYEVSTETNLELVEGIDSASDLILLNYLKNINNDLGEPNDLNDSIQFNSYHALNTQFNHNWNVRDYPFDSPQLKIQFQSQYDSSDVFIDLSSEKIAYFLPRTENLKDGFLIKSISVEKDYLNSDNDKINESENARNKVLERITFLVNLNRDGSWLYLKLFLGSFLSFLLSWLVFAIPKNDFGARVELSVGSVFGAVGNRAYVESIMPDVQVFTKADMINNIVISLIIFNIIIVVVQRNKKIFWSFFESNLNAAIYSAFIFIVLNSAILLW